MTEPVGPVTTTTPTAAPDDSTAVSAVDEAAFEEAATGLLLHAIFGQGKFDHDLQTSIAKEWRDYTG
ncbi:MAG: hypothetical protein MUE98_01025 [Rhodobacteraceae bacterium]|jgi:hypothetical protein|nr:hypothetical protein [Paracoccaceae bacterium]